MKTTLIVLLGSIIAFTSCEMNEGSQAESENSAVAKSNLSLAYVNSDSLATNYLYFDEVNGRKSVV